MLRRLSGPRLVVGSSLIAQGLLVFSGPLAVRLLGLDGRGEVAFVFAAVLLLAQVGPFGIPQAWSYAIANGITSGAALLRAYGRGYGLRCLVVAVLGASAIGLLATVTSNPLTNPAGALLAAGVGIAVLMLAVLSGGIAEGGGRYRQLAAVRGLPSVLYTAGLVVLTVLAAHGHRAGVVVVLAVYFGAWAAVTSACLILQVRGADAAREVPSPGRIRGFGRLMLGAASAPIDNLGIDQLLVGILLGHVWFGAYTVALAFSTPIWVILAAFGSLTVAPIARMTGPTARRAFARRWLLRGAAVGLAMVAMIELLLRPVTGLAFGSEALVAVGPARFMVAAGLLLGIRRLAGSMLQGLGRPGAASASELAGFVVMVGGMLTLAPLWGLRGACVAMLLAGGTAAIGTCAALYRATRSGRESLR